VFVVALVAAGSAHAATITQVAEVMSKLGADLGAIGNATGTIPRVSACSSLAADGRVLLGDQQPADVPPVVWRRVRWLARIAVRDGTQCARDGYLDGGNGTSDRPNG
jgi:hypothetical protein